MAPNAMEIPKEHSSEDRYLGNSRRLRLQDCCSPQGSFEPFSLFEIRSSLKSDGGEKYRRFTPLVSSLETLNKHLELEQSKTCSVRVFSLFQEDSWSRLTVSEPTLLTILAVADAHEDFKHIIKLFSTNRKNYTGAADCGYFFCLPSAERLQIGYGFKYPDRRDKHDEDGEDGEEWTIRHSAVFQSITPKPKQFSWVILHSHPAGLGFARFKEDIQNETKALELIEKPLRQHIRLITEYLENWEQYLSFFDKKACSIATSINAYQPDKIFEMSPTQYPDLQEIQTELQPHEAVFSSHERALRGLRDFNHIVCKELSIAEDIEIQIDSMLQALRARNEACLHKMKSILQIAAGADQRLSAILMLNNQMAMRTQSDSMVALTGQVVQLAHVSQQQGADISRMTVVTLKNALAVKAITVISLIILPSTVSLTFFDSQLIYRSSSGSIAFSPQIWIPFAISIPITILVVIIWLFWERRASKKVDSLFTV